LALKAQNLKMGRIIGFVQQNEAPAPCGSLILGFEPRN
jgi:hypothetical protein